MWPPCFHCSVFQAQKGVGKLVGMQESERGTGKGRMKERQRKTQRLWQSFQALDEVMPSARSVQPCGLVLAAGRWSDIGKPWRGLHMALGAEACGLCAKVSCRSAGKWEAG